MAGREERGGGVVTKLIKSAFYLFTNFCYNQNVLSCFKIVLDRPDTSLRLFTVYWFLLNLSFFIGNADLICSQVDSTPPLAIYCSILLKKCIWLLAIAVECNILNMVNKNRFSLTLLHSVWFATFATALRCSHMIICSVFTLLSEFANLKSEKFRD